MAEAQGGLSRWVSGVGWLAVALFVLGPLLAHLRVAPAMTGFALFGLGGLLGLVGTVLGLVAVIRAGPGRGQAAGKLLPALAVLVVFIALAARRGSGVPAINDITTDPSNPPQFVQAQSLPANAGRDMGYPGVEFARQQQEGYPDLRSVRLAMAPDEAFVRVQAAARAMPGWVLIREDATARAIEGVDASYIFRFEDDFVIEVRDEDGASVVHMRSKSRDGRGDLGVNARRIHDFLESVNW